VNGGVGQFPLSEIEPDQRAISTRSTASAIVGPSLHGYLPASTRASVP
jgi:hypothetical protein